METKINRIVISHYLKDETKAGLFTLYFTLSVNGEKCSGTSLEVVSRMLGHSTTKQTEQTYTRILKRRIALETNQFLTEKAPDGSNRSEAN